MSAPAQVQRPRDLAEQLFTALMSQCNNDTSATSRMSINFIWETLVYAISASTRDDVAYKALLKSVGESIINAPRPPK